MGFQEVASAQHFVGSNRMVLHYLLARHFVQYRCGAEASHIFVARSSSLHHL